MKYALLKEIDGEFVATGETFEASNVQEYLDERGRKDGRSYSAEPASEGIVAGLKRVGQSILSAMKGN